MPLLWESDFCVWFPSWGAFIRAYAKTDSLFLRQPATSVLFSWVLIRVLGGKVCMPLDVQWFHLQEPIVFMVYRCLSDVIL